MAMYPPPGTRRRAHKCNSFECSMGGGTDQQKKQVLKRSRSKQSRVRTPPRAMLQLRSLQCCTSPTVGYPFARRARRSASEMNVGPYGFFWFLL